MSLPPWWILNDVKPAAPDKDMGGWTACQFSPEQQVQFGCNADGEVKDQSVHDAALAALPTFPEMEKCIGFYIPAGGDLLEDVVTVEDAKKKALEIDGCRGFCFEGEDSGALVKVFFKNSCETFAGEGWTTYKCPSQVEEEPLLGEPLIEVSEVVGGMIVGGPSEEQDANEDVQKICDDLKQEIEKAAKAKGWNGILSSLKVLKCKTQVVAGTNYFVKATINDSVFFHLRIHEPLPHTGEAPSLAAIDVEKGNVPVDYF